MMRLRGILVTLVCAAATAIPHYSECAMAKKKAVVVGSTGAVGNHVVRELLSRNWTVITLARRKFDHDLKDYSEGLYQHIIPLSKDHENEIYDAMAGADAFFNCLGTTRSQAGSAEAFVAIERDTTDFLSGIAKNVGIRHVAVVSAEGANSRMPVLSTYIHPMLYIRTMGEKENVVVEKSFPSVTIFKPGLLNRLKEDRTMEQWMLWLFPDISLRVDILAAVMVKDAEEKIDQLHDAKTNDIKETYITGNAKIKELFK